MKVDVYNFLKDEKKSLDLPEDFFNLPFNADFIYQVVRAQSLNLRKSNAHTKTRGEVRGGGKKPWPQKYTGRARHGSIRSPIWVGGGVVFGPRNEKSYFRKINKKAKNKALFMVLSQKIRDNEVIFTDEITPPKTLKTKEFKLIFADFIKRVFNGNIKTNSKFLIITSVKDQNLKQISKNLPQLNIIPSDSVSALLILSNKYVILPKESIEKLLKRSFKTSK